MTRPLPTLAVLLVVSLSACEPASDGRDASPAPADEGAELSVPEASAAAFRPVPASEYEARRESILDALPDGILLLQARPSEKAMEQWGFVQDPSFFYFSGMAELPGAVLALDGPARQAHLFLPPDPQSFGMAVDGLVPAASPETAERHGLASARRWEELVPWISRRLTEGVEALYVDEPRRPPSASSPPGMPPTAGRFALWRRALADAFPGAVIRGAGTRIMRQRAVKSDAEVEILERNARTTAASLLAVARRLGPGVRQRDTEAAMVAACIAAGGQGPSFWPWTMSGPNARVPSLVGAFFRYDQGDRVARAGELVRVDIGCAGGHYGADVGRTLPVSGAFDEGQAEAWNLLIVGHRAGLDAMADGVPVSEVRAASARAVEAAAAGLSTDAGRAALDAILRGGEGTWHVHGVGVESGESIPEVLRAGMVVAYEPGFSVGPDAYYLEDMILVTETGHRVLSTDLPYSAEEIAAAMR